jgi:hypothetical protein
MVNETIETLTVKPQEVRVLRAYAEAKNTADRDMQAAFTAFLAAHGYSGGSLVSLNADLTTITVKNLEVAP